MGNDGVSDDAAVVTTSHRIHTAWDDRAVSQSLK